MPQTSAFTRRYIMLTPVTGRASGHARLECQRSHCSITIHAVSLPDLPTRALLLSGDENTGAVLDLGLMQTLSPRRAALCRGDLDWQGSWHTLAIVADWPQAQVLLWGQVQPAVHSSLWQVKQAVAHYLALPAPDAVAAPERPAVLRLRPRLST